MDYKEQREENIRKAKARKRLIIAKVFGYILGFIMLIVGAFYIFTTDSYRSKMGAYGSKHKIELIGCDGTVIKTWISSGKVASESTSDGYYFNVDGTGQLIEVSGTLIITQL